MILCTKYFDIRKIFELPKYIQSRIMVKLYKHKRSKTKELQVEGDGLLIKVNAQKIFLEEEFEFYLIQNIFLL